MTAKPVFLILSLLCMCTPKTMVAQKTPFYNFVPGYILQPNGDTLKGQIDYGEWSETPKWVRFRTDNQSEGKKYEMSDMNGFGILSPRIEHYIKARILYYDEPLSGADMTTYDNLRVINADPQLNQDTVFLWTLAKGTVNLYEWENPKQKRYHYFIEKGQSGIKELVTRNVLIKNYNQRMSVKIEAYRQQLTNLFSDCPKLEKDIKNLFFSRSHIVALISKYNNCTGKNLYAQKKEKAKGSFAVMSGATLPVLSLLDRYHNNINGSGSPKQFIMGSLMPPIGVSYGLQMLHTFSIGFELQLSSYKTKNITNYNGIGFTRHTEVDMDILSSKLNFYSIYFFNRSTKIKPYAKMGFGYAYFLKHNYKETVEEDNIVYSVEDIKLKKAQGSVFLGLGSQLKRLSLEARVELGLTNLREPSYFNEQLNIHSASILAIYAF